MHTMKTAPFALALATLAAHPGTAHADPCALVSSPQVIDAALRYLSLGSKFASFCAPCHDTVASFSQIGAMSKSERVGMDEILYAVAINAVEVDLAYIYVSVSDGHGGAVWSNLGLLSGCGATNVPAVLPHSALPAQSAPVPLDGTCW
jgi:hypothetical protein